jgi:hypothetical protein
MGIKTFYGFRGSWFWRGLPGPLLKSLKNKYMLWFWKHKDSKAIIHEDCYKKLPDEHKKKFLKATTAATSTHTVVEDNGNFALSMAVGMATDNIALGYVAGGSLSGAILGEMMHSHELTISDSPNPGDIGGFGGGDGGGGGAGASWGSDSPSASQDSSSSYESGPSSDSSSSFDSGSSSFDSGS